MTKKQNYHTIRYGNKDGELKFGHITDNNELLAVGKLSKPVRKSFNEEILLRVRLDF